ncbi:NAD-dependent epimerase/dehydratase family protein [Streptomyces sp. NPDC008079]|uniref:NAD-dependent epimerase/dehydratase family protein n=1 Tax=Streptomyces sp. NPDC008079 TaxID=3364806 RepID=UPI0036E6F47D
MDAAKDTGSDRRTGGGGLRILLAGGSGVLGRSAAKELTAAGHQVVQLGRGASHDIRADLLDRDALLRAVDGLRFDVVVHAATELSGKSMTRHRDMDGTNTLRTAGSRHLLEAARTTGAWRCVTESMMFGYGYGDHGEGPVTEAGTPFGPHSDDKHLERHVAAMRVNEELVLGADGVEGVALRFGLFYGAGVTDTLMLPLLRKRTMPVVDDTHRQVSWVAAGDAARAVALAVTSGRPGQAYNIADDRPLGFATHIRAVADAYGVARPLTVPAWVLRATPLMRAIMGTRLKLDSAKAAAELGWRPSYRDSAQGVRAIAAGPVAGAGPLLPA